jgi:DNA-binding NtrC family response regulator
MRVGKIGATPKMLLVIEDDPNDAFLIQQAFVPIAAKCVVHVCRNVTEAKCYLEGIGIYADRTRYPFPNAVVSDFRIGPETGVEFFRWLRSRQEFANVSAVLMSGSSPERTLKEASDIGGVTVIEKPMTFERLLKIADDLCEQA